MTDLTDWKGEAETLGNIQAKTLHERGASADVCQWAKDTVIFVYGEAIRWRDQNPAQLRPHAPNGGVIADPKFFKFYGSADCKSCETGRVTLFVANDECMECNPDSYQRKPSPHAPKGGEECDVCGGLGYVECGTGESATSWKQACPCQENSEAHPPATEARIEKGLIDGVEVDFLIENPPATGARLGRFIERMRELGQAMPPNAVSMEIQKALREFEVKG